ncbi:4Fe-4S binding protein [Methanoculleus chikugoensis]|uniref:4Fe-4S binding protein n=1 Tax=Methanoculleus chikugoensis TaxID=118126 RepID=UPI001FB24C67|nr:4Fe-4S binding protein [Methanoculleus chikugoensis]
MLRHAGLARAIEEQYGGCELPRKLKISIAGVPEQLRKGPAQRYRDHGGEEIPPRFYADECEGCGACEKVCREGAVRVVDDEVRFSGEACIGCGDCIAICPKDAVGVASEGLRLYLGGRSGRVIRVGTEAEGLVAEEEILDTITKLLDYFRENALPGERLGEMMERVGGIEEVFAAAGMRPRS